VLTSTHLPGCDCNHQLWALTRVPRQGQEAGQSHFNTIPLASYPCWGLRHMPCCSADGWRCVPG
jgi:hypothetical protein